MNLSAFTKCMYSLRLEHELVLMSSISAIVSGVVVIVVTWAKLYRSSKLARHTIHGRTVLQTMLEYGTIYFVIILVLDILQLAFYFLSLQAVMGTSYIALFLDPLTSILICRFILNLRETNEQPQVSSTPSSLTLEFGMSPSSLPSFIQSMAGPVHFTLTTNDTYTTSDNVFLGDLDEL
ncbi:hypothetical protein C8Q78DRAFT_229002 [Trametes maxima]|nr:hypothetical protein C8Q78DRAFT_229002 [Trametes maxima]